MVIEYKTLHLYTSELKRKFGTPKTFDVIVLLILLKSYLFL